MQKTEFTDDFVRSLPFSPSDKPEVFADIAAPCLKLVVTRDKKMFFVTASMGDARIRLTIRVGAFPQVTTADARGAARNFRSIVRSVIENESPQAPRHSPTSTRTTLAEVLNDYVESLPQRRHSKRSASDQAFIRRFVLDPRVNHLLRRPACDVTAAQAGRLIEAISRRRGTSFAESSLVKLRTMYNWAMRSERREHYGVASNPFKHLAARHGLSVESRPPKPGRSRPLPTVGRRVSAADAI